MKKRQIRKIVGEYCKLLQIVARDGQTHILPLKYWPSQRIVQDERLQKAFYPQITQITQIKTHIRLRKSRFSQQIVRGERL